ncbi:MAG: SbcC/MukB-like Walker B domain-containing protein [Acidimicrobiia bacterium]|nr:SbcC/MukB-like Walker B domain-containing protein [Acidimicrobiia bacterium]
MNESLRRRSMSSGMTVQLSWVLHDDASDAQRAIAALLEQEPTMLGTDERDRLRAHFAGEIRAARAEAPTEPYRVLLARVLDHRRWRTFGLRLVHPDGRREALTRRVFNRLSGGERATALHLPLFAAAASHYRSARPEAPRLIALDEAFAGIDGDTTERLMALTVEFDLDLFLTGHDLWATFETVPAVAIYDLVHLRDDHAVHALAYRWDGAELARDPA